MPSNLIGIDIIIPTKDNDTDLELCLNSLMENLSFANTNYRYNVILVREHESKKINSNFFTLIKNPKYKDLNILYIIPRKSIGFTKALNVGIKFSLNKKVKSDYIATLHDDVIIFKGWLDSLINPMLENAGIYGTGSITANELDSQCISKCYNYFDLNGIGDVSITDTINEFFEVVPSNNLNIAEKVKNLNYYEFKEKNCTDRISFFSSLFRITAFEKFGLPDENLFSSFKVENEFCKRLFDNKKTVALVPQAFVIHKCKSFSFENERLIQDKIKRNITLENIKIKETINPILSKKRKQYVVYTYLPCEQTPILNNMFGFHDKSNTDFYCFTNREKVESDTWNIINILKFKELDVFSKNDNTLKEYLKLHPHHFFTNYNASIWIDFNDINMLPFNTQEFVRLMDENTTTLTLDDKIETCVWKYLIKRYKNDGISDEMYDNVLATYRFYNMPQNNGFMNTSILIRKHNNEDCINLMENIWKYYMNIGKDDKLWFNLFYWLFKQNYYSIPYNLYQLKMNDIKKKIEILKKDGSLS